MTLEEELRFLILGAQREGSRVLAAELAPLDLTPSQGEVLRRLADAEPLSLAALGGLLVCETGSPSRLVNTMVEKGLVTRVDNPEDRRQVTLRLTEAGRHRAAEVAKIEDRLHGSIRERLGEDAMESIARTMRRFLAGTVAGETIERRKAGDKSTDRKE